MGVSQSLAVVVLSTQLLALIIMVIMLAVDADTFLKIGKGRWVVLPGLVKITKLFRETPKPIFMAIYLFAMIFVLFSYASAVILVVDFVDGLMFD